MVARVWLIRVRGFELLSKLPTQRPIVEEVAEWD